MNLASVTHQSLAKSLGQEIPEVYVVIAKHQIAGMTNESIAEIIGCDVQDVVDVEVDSIYQTVRQTVGAMVAASQADQPLIWDSLESIAGKRLLERIEFERDPEFLLKVAATANRMTRRGKPQGEILDPQRAGRAAVTLTSRMVEKITQAGHRTVMQERTLSIHDGSMQNPTYDDVNAILGVGKGLTPGKITVQQEQAVMLHDLHEILDEDS